MKGKLKTSSESKLAAEIRTAIGAGSDDVEIMTPQFERPVGEPDAAQPPVDRAGFDALRMFSDEKLIRLGMRRWGREHENGRGEEWGRMLWLFPSEWYDSIPEGYPIISIMFQKEPFVRGETDNDIRFGCLAFGILHE